MQSPILRGMAHPAWLAYVEASRNANIDIDSRDDKRLVQLIGNAVASAGYHAADGTYQGRPYCAAADMSVRNLSRSQIATWIEELCSQGFVAFYRNWPGNLHIHANYAGIAQKRQLDSQNEDFFAGRDGLVGSRRIDDEWWYPEKERRKIPEKMFRLSNPKTGVGKVVTRADVVTVTPPKSLPLYLNKETTPRLWMPLIDGVSLAPVRAFGSMLGLAVFYDPATHSVKFAADDLPIAITNIAGVGHAPIRQLVREVGLKIVEEELKNGKVVVTR